MGNGALKNQKKKTLQSHVLIDFGTEYVLQTKFVADNLSFFADEKMGFFFFFNFSEFTGQESVMRNHK